MKDTNRCPFCGEETNLKYFWKGDCYSYGCFNYKRCVIHPATPCVKSGEEAKRMWEKSFVDGHRR